MSWLGVAAAVGATAGAVKNRHDKKTYERQQKAESEITRYGALTGRQGQTLPGPNSLFSDMLKGSAVGVMAGTGLGAGAAAGAGAAGAGAAGAGAAGAGAAGAGAAGAGAAGATGITGAQLAGGMSAMNAMKGMIPVNNQASAGGQMQSYGPNDNMYLSSQVNNRGANSVFSTLGR